MKVNLSISISIDANDLEAVLETLRKFDHSNHAHEVLTINESGMSINEIKNKQVELLPEVYRFFNSARGIDSYGQFTKTGTFVVKRGSKAVDPKQWSSVLFERLRNELDKEDTFDDSDKGFLIFKRDVEFSSMSIATHLIGNIRNESTSVWTDKEGTAYSGSKNT